MATPPIARRPRVVALAAVAVSAALLLSACSDGTASTTVKTPVSADAASGGTYTLGLSAPDGNIDPVSSADYNAMFLVGLASAGLINVSPTGTLEPQLGTSWAPASNGLAWTIQLRQGAKFSDGSPITADDVVATFDSILGPKSTSPAKSSFAGIVKSVAAGSDGASVVFALDRPYADFPYLLTGANTDILPKGTDDAKWIDNPVGAGQFLLKDYVAGQSVTYVKNPNYWDAAHVKLDGIQVKFFADAQSQLLAFQSGEIDQINADPSVTAALDLSKYRQIKVGYTKFDGIAFNVTKAPFNDVKVRQAVAWALDRDAISKTVYGGGAVVANDEVYYPDYGIQPQGLTQRSQDLGQVKQLLGGKKVSFTITTYTDEQTLAELVQQQLNATGSFDVKLKVLTSAQYYADGASTPWLNAPVTITDWGERLPSQYVGLLYAAKSDWNASHYANPQLEKLSAQFDAATDAATEQSLANQIAKIEWTDVPVIVPAFKLNDLILSPSVKGDFANGQNFGGGFDFRDVTVTGK